MIPYPSIDSVWTRDKTTNLLRMGDLRNLTWDSVGAWLVTEKVDGTNLRVVLGFDPEIGPTFEIKGRTDKAQLPPDLPARVRDEFKSPDLHSYFGITEDVPRTVTLYGEGYGPGIQKSGGLYRASKGFILFDVRMGNAERGYWLDFAEVINAAEALGLNIVPVVGTLYSDDIPQERDALCYYLPRSFVAEQEREAEGIVARPVHELQDKFGNRVMWKLTFRDFPCEEAVAA